MDHFNDDITSAKFWDQSSTSVVHLPQNRLEVLMRRDLNLSVQGRYFGNKATAITPFRNKFAINIQDSHQSSIQLTSNFVIGADGAHSLVRRLMGIKMEGLEAMQALMNVHFKCPGLYGLLKQQPSMIYFVFNEVSIRTPFIIILYLRITFHEVDS